MVTTPRPVEAPANTPRIPPSTSDSELGRVLVVVRLPESWPVTDTAFGLICRDNPDWEFETTEEGALLIMVREGKTSSRIESEIIADLVTWNRDRRGGWVQGPSGAVRLTEKFIMVPDVSWVSQERESAEPEHGQGTLLPVCPEFVVEVRSETDSLTRLQGKMLQWIELGALLGWLVDPHDSSVWVYRPDGDPEHLERPTELSGEDVCKGLIVDFERVWEISA